MTPPRIPGKRGRLPALPKRLALKFVHEYAPLPPVEYPVDVTGGITDWGMLGNGPDPTCTVQPDGVGNCLGPDTRVLTADLRWVPISSLRVGDELVGFEETPINRGQGRRFLTSRVEAVKALRKPCYDLELEDGTIIRSSFDHQWYRGSRGMSAGGAWLRTDAMRSDSALYQAFPTWESEDSYDLGYLAAAFDGEGCLSRSTSTGALKSVIFSQRDNRMLSEVARILNHHGYRVARRTMTYSSLSTKGYDRLVLLGGRRETAKFLGHVRPKRLLDLFQPEHLRRVIANPVQIVERKDVGEQWVTAIQTSTRTFVAEGMLSHNCTFAGRQHYRMAKSARGQEVETWETSNQLVEEYLTYDRGVDQGANIAKLLLHWFHVGKIVAFAPVDHTDRTKLDAALAAFTGVYCGVSLTDDADELFSGHQPWTVADGQRSDPNDGHCVLLVKADGHSLDGYVTWGADQAATTGWTAECVEEAWVIITQEDVDNHNIDIDALRGDIEALGGTAKRSAESAA
jgi:hypothetical protein